MLESHTVEAEAMHHTVSTNLISPQDAGFLLVCISHVCSMAMGLLLPPLQKWDSPTAFKPTASSTKESRPTLLQANARSLGKKQALPEARSDERNCMGAMLPPLREPFRSTVSISVKSSSKKEALSARKDEEVTSTTSMLPPLLRRSRTSSGSRSPLGAMQTPMVKRPKVSAKSPATGKSVDEKVTSTTSLLPPLKRSRESYVSRSAVGAMQERSVKRRKVSAKSPDTGGSVDVEVTSMTSLLPALRKRSRESSASRSAVGATQEGLIIIKRRKVSAKWPDTGETVDVGLVSESRQEHLRRHDGGRNDCPRCRFYLFGAGWCRTYGSTKDPRTNDRSLVVWIQERPQRLQGKWALGCAFCAWAAVRNCARRGRKTGRAQASSRLCAKWSRHETRCATLQAEQVRQHASCQALSCSKLVFATQLQHICNLFAAYL